jgi:hypothetical protein
MALHLTRLAMSAGDDTYLIYLLVSNQSSGDLVVDGNDTCGSVVLRIISPEALAGDSLSGIAYTVTYLKLLVASRADGKHTVRHYRMLLAQAMRTAGIISHVLALKGYMNDNACKAVVVAVFERVDIVVIMVALGIDEDR